MRNVRFRETRNVRFRETRNVRFRETRNAKCPVSRNAKCEMPGFAKREMRNARFRETRNAKCEMRQASGCEGAAKREMRNVRFRETRNAKCEMSSFAKCEMRNVQFREMRNAPCEISHAKLRAISQGQIDVPKWNRAAGGAKLREVRSSVDAPSTPSLQLRRSGSNGTAMAKKPPVCEACKGGKYGLRVEQLGPGVCCQPGGDGHLPPGAKQAVKCTACRQPTGYCTQLGKPGHLSADRCEKIPAQKKTPAKPATNHRGARW